MKYLNENGLQVVADKINTRLKTVTEMPSTANDGAVRLYVGTDGTYLKGHIYKYNNETYHCYISDEEGGFYYHFYIKEIEVGATVYGRGSPDWFQKADSISELTSDFSEIGADTLTITAASPSSITVSNNGALVVASRSSDDDLSNIGWTDITAGGGTVDLNFDPTSQNAQSGIAVSQALKQVVSENTKTDWEDAPWLGDFTGYGSRVWTDGDNVYYSDNGSDYVLNKSTNTWEEKVWTGPLTSFNAENIWNDADNVYYSDGSQQYVLNKISGEWETKTWNGLSNLHKGCIWIDGDNIYYSDYNDHYVLNKATSTWEPKTWQGLTSFYGYYVWTDGVNVYYSNYNEQYVLNKATSTWEPKTWYGLTSFDCEYVWTDGDNVYYSDGTSNYVLNKSTDTWENVNPWDSYYPAANYIWKMDDQIYVSGGDYEQKQMTRTTK